MVEGDGGGGMVEEGRWRRDGGGGMDLVTFDALRCCTHCATAFSMQSCAESAYQPYADGYH